MQDSRSTPDFAPPSSEVFDLMSLSEALDAIPDDVFVRMPPQGVPDTGASRLLALDVLETPEVFEIHASVPGMAPESLDITVLGESVRIAGEGRAAETPFVTGESDYRHHWLVRERPAGRFDRTVSLPSPVNPAGTDATVCDGVLIVRLPKVRRSATVRIPVRAGDVTLATPADDGVAVMRRAAEA